MTRIKNQFWLLHAVGGPIPTNEANGGDLEWLGAIVKDINDPRTEFDPRPESVTLADWKDYHQVPMNDFSVILQRMTGVGLKVKLANAIGVDVDVNGNTTNQAQRKQVVCYKLLNEKKVLEKILDADNYRDKITKAVSSIRTTRWFVAGYLVAKPVAGLTNPAKPVEEKGTGRWGRDIVLYLPHTAAVADMQQSRPKKNRRRKRPAQTMSHSRMPDRAAASGLRGTRAYLRAWPSRLSSRSRAQRRRTRNLGQTRPYRTSLPSCTVRSRRSSWGSLVFVSATDQKAKGPLARGMIRHRCRRM